jgi:hypothetical protein
MRETKTERNQRIKNQLKNLDNAIIQIKKHHHELKQKENWHEIPLLTKINDIWGRLWQEISFDKVFDDLPDPKDDKFVHALYGQGQIDLQHFRDFGWRFSNNYRDFYHFYKNKEDDEIPELIENLEWTKRMLIHRKKVNIE